MNTQTQSTQITVMTEGQAEAKRHGRRVYLGVQVVNAGEPHYSFRFDAPYPENSDILTVGILWPNGGFSDLAVRP